MFPQDQIRPGFWNWFFFRLWRPLGKVKHICFFYLLLGAISLCLTILTLSFYSTVVQVRMAYLDKGECIHSYNDTHCFVQLEVNEQIPAPVLFMYVIENVYINHRNYLSSYSPNQLAGAVIDAATAESTCQPFVYNSNFPVNQSYTGASINSAAVASPCGFKAKLFFKDTFEMSDPNGNVVPISETNISKQAKVSLGLFKRQTDSAKYQWMDPLNEHFINWMESEAMTTRYKLWGRISQSLPAGNYTVLAANKFQIGSMNIRKSVELLSPSAIGGRIPHMPITFAFIALFSIAYAIVIWVKLGHYDRLCDSHER